MSFRNLFIIKMKNNENVDDIYFMLDKYMKYEKYLSLRCPSASTGGDWVWKLGLWRQSQGEARGWLHGDSLKRRQVRLHAAAARA